MLGLQRFASGMAVQLFRRPATYGSLSNMRTTTTAAAAASTAAAQKQNTTKTSDKNIDKPEGNKKSKNQLVAAAFESLNEESTTSTTSRTASPTPDNGLGERISSARTVNALLAATEGHATISRQHALRVVSILAEWTTSRQVKLSDFENDARFLRLCRLMGRNLPAGKSSATNAEAATNPTAASYIDKKKISGFRTDDLNTVLGVAGDDEAAKLIASISLGQMVKVMSALAQRKRRSTPLLRSLAFNISSSTDQLDLKQCGDVLYAMAVLNFQDSVLAAKTCADVQTALPNLTKKSAVVGSILTSLGILRYRDLDIMEALTQWLLQHLDICRPQDISAYFLTSAIISFKSAQHEDVCNKLSRSVLRADFPKPNDWLDHIWALTLLRAVDNQQLESVLSQNFIEELSTSKTLTPTAKMKLLNVQSYAQLLAVDYKGALLPTNSQVHDVPMAHAKSKQLLLNGLLDALKSLLPSSNHVKSLTNSKMGFLIDAVCVFDNKRNPLPFDKEHDANAIKLALMVVDFHDVCHGPHRAASGQVGLMFDLLEKSGYKVIAVPYNEFNTSDKLLKRVQYLEAKFKSVVAVGSRQK